MEDDVEEEVLRPFRPLRPLLLLLLESIDWPGKGVDGLDDDDVDVDEPVDCSDELEEDLSEGVADSCCN